MIYAENILVCIAAPLLVSLFFMRGEVRRYVGTFVLGMAASLVSAYIGGFLSLLAKMSTEDAAVFLSPMVEELMKLLALLFLFEVFLPEVKNPVMLAVAIGTGFATFENCCYILTNGAENLTYIIIRGLAVGVMHIVSILCLSIWIVITKQLKVLSFPTIVGGLSLAMIFHSLYNLLVSEPGISRTVGYLLPILTAGCLYPLYRRLQRIMNKNEKDLSITE